MKFFFINHNISLRKTKNVRELWHYSAGNLGNSYIGYTTIKMITGGLRVVDGIPNLWDFDCEQFNVDFINKNYSKVVLCLQDQIRVEESYYKPNYTRICNFLEKIKLPFIVLSLGANAIQTEYDPELHLKLSKEKIRFLKLIADKSVEMGVRGYYSAEILNKLGIKNVNPIGCHTIFFSKKNIFKKDISALKRIVTHGGLRFINNPSDNLEFSYVLQCMSEEKTLFDEALRVNKFTLSDIKTFDFSKLSKRKQVHFPRSIQQWQKIIKQSDFSIGRRVHGTIMALNSGVPSLLASGDLRAREISELFSIPRDYTIDDTVDVKAMYQKVDFSDFNKKRAFLYNEFLEFAKRNDFKVS